MNRNILGLLIAIITMPLIAIANSDSQYPAAYFQPKIIFADDEIKVSSYSVQSSVFDPDYPASSFQPKIIYVDASVVSSNYSKAETSTFDAKYPAANFNPTIIYP